MSHAAVLPAREDGYIRKKWNNTEYRTLYDLGVLEPGQYELLEGEIICKKHRNINRFALPPQEDGYARKKWCVNDCQTMTDSGLFNLDGYELLEGEIISKMGQGRLHINSITLILNALAAIYGMLSLQTQAEIGVGVADTNSNPQPDIAVLRGAVTDYRHREPDPATEVLLVVEASNSTLRGDTTTKVEVYARNGVCEYWVVAIARRELIVYRDPGADGYADVQTYGETDSVSPLSAPHATVRVADLLP